MSELASEEYEEQPSASEIELYQPVQYQQQKSKVVKKRCKIVIFISAILVILMLYSVQHFSSTIDNYKRAQQTVAQIQQGENIQQKQPIQKQQAIIKQKMNADPLSTSDSQQSEKYVNSQIQALLKNGRYFDIHYFVDDFHTKLLPSVLNQAKTRSIKDADEARQLLVMTKNKLELEDIAKKMKYPQYRPDIIPDWLKDQSPQIINLTYFANSLNLDPNNKDFHQAEFAHFDELYSIGKYGKQLPLCLAMVGKNNGGVILKMYDSIGRQNYTNYRIIQVDDNSDDDTIAKTKAYLDQHSFLKERTTLVKNHYERNALYNRHFANMNYCADGDIVIDLDSDDWLIGNQVFQLVNSLYQAGNDYKGQKYDLWSAFLNNIIYYPGSCCPKAPLSGQFPDSVHANHAYRASSWRSTHLRTYLWRVYSKIDANDYIDSINLKKGQYFAESPDVYMMFPILQMSGPKHMRILDEFVYCYTGSAGRDQTYPYYTMFQGRNQPIYLELGSLDDKPARGPIVANENGKKAYEQNRQKSIIRFQTLRSQVLQIYSKNKKSNIRN